MDSLPEITDPQRQACEKWEVQFDTDHVEILQFAISTTLSQKRSTRSASSLGQPSQQDLCIQKQMLELEALKGMGEQLSKLVDSAEKTSSEIAANTNLVKDARQSLRTMDEKIKEVNLDLNAQIEGLKTKMEVNQIQLRTIQEQVLDQETRLPKRSQTPAAKEDISNRAMLKSIEATDAVVVHVPRASRSSRSTGTRRITPVLRPNFEHCTRANITVLQPYSSCWKSCCRRRSGTRSANASPMKRFYGRTEVMDQTYLDDLLQIPPLKNQDAANLKTFANRLHGAVATLIQSRYAHELQSRTTLMAIEAKLTPHLKDKWNEKRKRAGAELNVLDLDDWVTVKSMSKQHGKNVFESLPTSTSKLIRFDDK
ncbi:hypothetical protein GHT06_006518 [Daphnia sinensis]|uniref:Uncharacterized protein n=1 Tax=Daphnia sinensis TaxID=1820382 RepID=A0AAD5PMF1_9CRUS|nr:hypothetical protein GHT06_006518 [Daphnia sinensis]